MRSLKDSREGPGRFSATLLVVALLIFPMTIGASMADSRVLDRESDAASATRQELIPTPGTGSETITPISSPKGSQEQRDDAAWQAEFGPQGTDGEVYALADYDGHVTLGGQFCWAGNQPLRNIAQWNGETWLDLAGGIGGEGESRVRALIEYDGVLIAGGSFSEAGGRPADNIAFWDGTAWNPLGSGMNARVSALAIHDGLLIAGGDFTVAGGVAAAYLAAWDGIGWRAVGPGLDGEVLAITPYHEQLVVGGCFLQAGVTQANHIARWDGSSWHPFGAGMDDDVHALVVYEQDLFAGGAFMQAGEVTSPRFAHWDGEHWVSIGALAFTEGNHRFNTLEIYNGDLIVGGCFTYGEQFRGRGDYVPSNVLRWGGGAYWIDMDFGLNGEVFDLAVCGEQLFAAGAFTRTSTHRIASRVSCWNELGWKWHHLGPETEIGPIVYALTTYGGDLIAGGSMEAAGGELVGCFARWDGERWSGFGGVSDGPVLSLLPYNSDLIMGGSFYWVAGDVPCQGIGRWDGDDWHTLADGLDYYPAYGPQVRVLREWEGDLLVGGRFFGAVDLPSPNIIRWDGTEWHPLGEGLPGTVYGMALYEGDVIAAHNQGGGTVCRWGGDAWVTMGEVFSGSIRTLVVFYGDLIAGGNLSAAGGTPVEGLALWDGLAWVPFDTSPGNTVWALEVHDEHLIATGDFPGGVLSWDGETWSSLGTGMNPDALVCSALSLGNGTDLYLGGDFEYSGDKVAYNLAHWSTAPVAVRNPITHVSSLLSASPNPFSRNTVLRLSLRDEDNRVLLTIHDSSGRIVRTILNDASSDGSVLWDGRTDRGNAVATGVYYARLRTGDYTGIQKITLIR